MRVRVVFSSVVVVALVATGCGDDGGAGGSPFGSEGGDDPVGQDDIDLGDVGLGDIDIDDLATGDLEDAIETAEGILEEFGGDGGSGTVDFNGDTIEFEAEFCFAFGDDLDVGGPGTAADGTPVWVSISHTVESRAELVEFFGEESIDLLFGDADPIVTDSFSLTYGQVETFGSGSDDLPAIFADSMTNTEIEMNVTGRAATGSGLAADGNYVLGDFDDMFPFAFQVSCS